MKATNLMGDEIELLPLRFEWMNGCMTLNVFRGKEFFCMVHPNGWNGYSKVLQYDAGEPIIFNLMESYVGFSDFKKIMDEWNAHITVEEALDYVEMKKAKEKARQELRKMV